MIVLPVPSLLSPPVLAELQLADLITSEEYRGLDESSDVVRVQSGKSPEVLSKTADVLRRHGFGKESNLLSGKQTQSLIHVPIVGLGDIDFFCVSRYLRRVSRYTRYIGGIQIIGNQSDT